MTEKDNVVNDALKITSVLNKHMDERPVCHHSVNEIIKEIFGNG
jgi:hypothetical protein